MIENTETTILKLVAGRPVRTTCPSEVARSLAMDHNARSNGGNSCRSSMRRWMS
ncbi:DUF3253 domain-containing protein [Rhizobium sp.]|uniref:DUF3253 domain-containing protein n=1 Tax=Rhizobium sp. TaxID=391 RepID=UPI003917C388